MIQAMNVMNASAADWALRGIVVVMMIAWIAWGFEQWRRNRT